MLSERPLKEKEKRNTVRIKKKHGLSIIMRLIFSFNLAGVHKSFLQGSLLLPTVYPRKHTLRRKGMCSLLGSCLGISTQKKVEGRKGSRVRHRRKLSCEAVTRTQL